MSRDRDRGRDIGEDHQVKDAFAGERNKEDALFLVLCSGCSWWLFFAVWILELLDKQGILRRKLVPSQPGAKTCGLQLATENM